MKEPAKIEKVTDDALSRSIFSSVIGIIICMVCLVGTTWAWYSLSVESGNNEMTGANFDFSVGITDNVELDGNGVYTFTGEPHTVTLTKTGTATKGFCRVEATKSGEEAESITTYYIVDFTGEEPAESISFTVTGSGTLKLIPMLGTPAGGYDPIPENGIELTLDTVTAMLPQQEKKVSQEETTSEKEELIDDETDDKEIGDSTDDKGTIEPDEDDEIVNENETPDEVPANPEQTEPETPSENQGNPEPEEETAQ